MHAIRKELRRIRKIARARFGRCRATMGKCAIIQIVAGIVVIDNAVCEDAPRYTVSICAVADDSTIVQARSTDCALITKSNKIAPDQTVIQCPLINPAAILIGYIRYD